MAMYIEKKEIENPKTRLFSKSKHFSSVFNCSFGRMKNNDFFNNSKPKVKYCFFSLTNLWKVGIGEPTCYIQTFAFKFFFKI